MSSTVNISKDVSNDFNTGVTTVGVSIVQAIPGNYPALKGAQVKCATGNTGIIYIGKSGVSTTDGFPLNADEGIFIPVDDLTKVYAISDTAGQKLHWLAI